MEVGETTADFLTMATGNLRKCPTGGRDCAYHPKCCQMPWKALTTIFQQTAR